MRLFWLLALLTGIAPFAAAQNDHVSRYEAHVFEDSSGSRMPYRLFRPANYDPSQHYPLVVYLHGGAGRGEDNRKQLISGNAWATGSFISNEVQERHPSFVLAAQTNPTGNNGWGGFDRPARETWDRTKTNSKYLPQPNDEPIDVLVRLIDSLSEDLSIDLDRVYAAGQSMGGYGTWGIITRYPDRFAAAVPVCGGGDPSAASRIGTPVWVFHGDADPRVAVEQSRMMVEALNAAGAAPRYTEYEGAGHGVGQKAFFDPQMIEWLFSQRRRQQ